MEDIGALAARSLELHGFNPRVLGDDVLEALCAHDWPGNLLEMERVVVRLAVMTGGRCIRREDLARHAPDLAAGHVASDAGRAPQRLPAVEQTVGPAPAQPDTPRAAHEGLHDGLKRALAYLKDHAAEPLTLGDLARQAHVSQSHLGFLFRSELGTTFAAAAATAHRARQAAAGWAAPAHYRCRTAGRLR